MAEAQHVMVRRPMRRLSAIHACRRVRQCSTRRCVTQAPTLEPASRNFCPWPFPRCAAAFTGVSHGTVGCQPPWVPDHQVSFVGDGDWHRCFKLQLKLFDTSSCPHSSCSFNGSYQPPLPKAFRCFSYMYDRTTAIGLLDGIPKQFGSQEMSQHDIAHAGESLCALDKQQTASRFSSHQDASKSSSFCGDVAYVAALLTALGFPASTKLTMTNKIKVGWCLGYLGRLWWQSAAHGVSCSF